MFQLLPVFYAFYFRIEIIIKISLHLDFVHECLHGIVQGVHEVAEVDGGRGASELGGEALVTVGQHVFNLVTWHGVQNTQLFKSLKKSRFS